MIVTVSFEAGHTPLEIVHTKEFAPTESPVTPDVGSVGIVTVELPTITVHNPVATVGVFPANVVVVEQTVPSAPALEVVGD